MMPDMGEKVCINHTDVQAVSRCVSCFKPLCGDCIHDSGGEDFCSDTCAEKHRTSSQRFDEFNERDKARKFKALLKKIAIFIILAAIGYYAYCYWSNNKDEIKKATTELEKKGRKISKEFNK